MQEMKTVRIALKSKNAFNARKEELAALYPQVSSLSLKWLTTRPTTCFFKYSDLKQFYTCRLAISEV